MPATLPIPDLAARLLLDPRDRPYLGVLARCAGWTVPGAIVIYALHPLPLWVAVVYLGVLAVGLMPPFILMLHFSTHRAPFRPPFRWMNALAPYVLCPLLGQSPGTYVLHHLGMHHREENLWEDVSSTLPYQRDSAWAFARYLFRFLFLGLPDLYLYFQRVGRKRLGARALAGEVGFWGVVGALFAWNPPATLVVFVLPVVIARVAMIAGNWGQHAFVDGAQPANPFRNSVTCIETPYNRRCFNDGFHAAHHERSSLHWSELPAHFERARERYAAEQAIVLRGLDFFQVWALLMLGRIDTIARRVVQLGPTPLPHAKIVELLSERLQPIPRPSLTNGEKAWGAGAEELGFESSPRREAARRLA